MGKLVLGSLWLPIYSWMEKASKTKSWEPGETRILLPTMHFHGFSIYLALYLGLYFWSANLETCRIQGPLGRPQPSEHQNGAKQVFTLHF